jgi:hypothetical protein
LSADYKWSIYEGKLSNTLYVLDAGISQFSPFSLIPIAIFNIIAIVIFKAQQNYSADSSGT